MPTSSAPRPETSRTPRVLAIMVNWNKKPFVDRLLSDLARLDRPPDDILVVDNASTDGSVEMIRAKHPGVHLRVHDKNLGGTGGFNAGLRWGLERGGYDLFWLLDNDIVVHPGALSALLKPAESDPRVGLVGSRIAVLDRPGQTQETGARIDWPICTLVKAGLGETEKSKTVSVDYAASCSLLARVRAVEEVGIWDEGYFIFFDDVEWGVRFNRAGWKVVATPESVVEHESFYDRRLTQPLPLRYLALRNGIYFFHSFCPPRHRVRALFYTFRRILADVAHFRIEGKKEISRCLERATADFFRSQRGACPHTFAPEPAAAAVPDSAVPRRKGAILQIAFANPDAIGATREELRRRFPDHRVEVLVPTEVSELDGFECEGLVRKPSRRFGDRIALARWATRRFDAIARPESAARFAFELFVPISILVGPKPAEFVLLKNRAGTGILHALTKPLVLAGAAALTVLALLKPRPRVDYFTWRRDRPPRPASGAPPSPPVVS